MTAKRFLIALTVMLTAVGVFAFDFWPQVPDKETVVVTDGMQDQQQANIECRDFKQAGVLDKDGVIEVLVWNIYKQNKTGWKSELESYLPEIQLGLLQEVSMSDEFKQWLYNVDWIGQQAKAFEVFEASAGVFNLAHVYPSKICAQLSTEPWLRLPKSALFATYKLSNGETLGVGNLHGINFTFGTDDYAKQVKLLSEKLKQHQGPVILAGDFNTWSEKRLNAVSGAMKSAGLREVHFEPDNRSRFMDGQVLDHIYYRGLGLEKAEAPTSDASDHNPLLASFRLIKRSL